jgi:glycosyltransferase involved in cell wall biosynthesis
MPDLSIALLAHNEAANIGAALESVKWAEEIVVVDASSEDATGEIARASGAKVLTEPNRTNLNINKNIAIDACRGDWVFVLDADELIDDDLAGEIRRVMSDGTADGFLIPRRNYVLGSWVKRGSQYPDLQLRLFRKGKGRFPGKHVHERVLVDGRIGRLACAMDHHPYPDLATMIRKNEFYARFEADKLFKDGVRLGTFGLLWRGFLKPFGRAVRRLVLKGGIRDGAPGVILIAFDFWNNALRHLILWEKRITNNE